MLLISVSLELIKRTLPPESISVVTLANELGLPKTTVYGWKKKFRESYEFPAHNKSSETWSSQDKFHIVMETYPLSEAELAEYCRRKGLYVEQIYAWRNQCMRANNSTVEDSSVLASKLKEETAKAKRLEKELSRKEKALAEAAALLVLRKKADAILGETEKDL